MPKRKSYYTESQCAEVLDALHAALAAGAAAKASVTVGDTTVTWKSHSGLKEAIIDWEDRWNTARGARTSTVFFR